MRISWTAQTGSCVLALFLFVTACGDREQRSAGTKSEPTVRRSSSSAPFRPRRPCGIEYGPTRSPHTWFQKS